MEVEDANLAIHVASDGSYELTNLNLFFSVLISSHSLIFFCLLHPVFVFVFGLENLSTSEHNFDHYYFSTRVI